MSRQLLERAIGILRPNDLDEFDLVELVLPDEPARVLSVGARFRPKAWRVSDEFQGQVGRVEDPVAGQVGQRNFSGRNQEQLALGRLARELEEILLELRQLARCR